MTHLDNSVMQKWYKSRKILNRALLANDKPVLILLVPSCSSGRFRSVQFQIIQIRVRSTVRSSNQITLVYKMISLNNPYSWTRTVRLTDSKALFYSLDDPGQIFTWKSAVKFSKWHLRNFQIFNAGSKLASDLRKLLEMTEIAKTVIQCCFLLPDF